MPEHDWNASYASGELPWDTGRPDEHLTAFVQDTSTIARALEIGCGTGTNSVWLASQGIEVHGIDVSPLAVEQARAKAEATVPDGSCHFHVHDFLARPPSGLLTDPFDFVFDRGCFHTFAEPEQRGAFAARVADLLRPGGLWLSLIGSTEGPARDMGPPRRSAQEVAQAIEPVLQLVTLRLAEFDTTFEEAPSAWFCLSRRRQPGDGPSRER